ncbi:MAG: IS4 family transposase [Methanobacteriota archaeon]
MEEALNGLFPPEWLRAKAEETGVVKRYRKVDPVLLFWVLVLGFGVGMQRTLASLHRRYEKAGGEKLARGSFYKRFDRELVRFLHECVLHGIEELARGPGRVLKERLRVFKDVLVQDSTIIRLHAALAKKWPATRARKVAAGVKVSVVVSAVADGVKSVRLFGERQSEVHTLRLGPWVKDRVLLVDLGFFKYQVFDRIQRNGGFFVSRLKENADPTITRLVRRVRGASVPVEGERLRDVLPRLKREVLDANVEVRFRHRAYGGSSSGDTREFRLVAVMDHDSGEYHVYVTNITEDVLSAEDVAALYGARWEIELVFKELKSKYAFDVINTKNPAIVEALVWVGILTLLASRCLYRVVLEHHDPAKGALVRFTKLRWANTFAENADALMGWVLDYAGVAHGFEERLAIYDIQGLDPNVHCERLMDRVRE